MSKREIDALAMILTDPENSSRTADEVSVLCIEALDDVRARTHRIAVVGQIQYEEAPGTHTVVLGPFSARGLALDPEKFARAIEGGTAAREAGQGLAWDSKSKRHRGRFMLVPVLRSARDAWDFYRGEAPASEIVQVATEWTPLEIQPVCICGLPGNLTCRFCGDEMERHCQRHDPQGDAHRCRNRGMNSP